MDFGYAQTGGDLFVWQPDAKTLWTGKAIIAPKPAIPWLMDAHLSDTLKTLRAIYKFLPDDSFIVPSNGPLMKKEGMLWHIDYLKALQQAVTKAVKKGLSLSETLETVKLEKFKGHKLFDWYHAEYNVPAAYREISSTR